MTKNPLTFARSIAVLSLSSLLLCSCGGDDAEPNVTKVEIVSMEPGSPASLKYYQTAANDRVKITFKYQVKEKDGVRIFLQARSTTGELSDTFYSPSPVFTGNGIDTSIMSVDSDESSVLVDKIRILIKSADQTETISETFVDVNFTFSE